MKLAAIVALVATVASCSSGSDNSADGEPTAVATPAEPATGATPGQVAEEDPIELGEVVEVVETGTTVPIVDFLGNTVTIFQWESWPEAMDEIDLFGVNSSLAYGGLAEGRGSGTRVIAADVEVCAADDQAPDIVPFMSRFQAVDADGNNPTTQDDDVRSSMIRTPVLNPMFSWPQAGECARGWQGLSWSGTEAPTNVQYVAVSRDDASFGEQHVYRWTVNEAASDAPQPDPEFATGMKSAFTAGSLAGWGTTVIGWRWVGDTIRLPVAGVSLGPGYAQPPAGTELVGVLLEVCAGPSGSFPSYGISPDGWNLIGPFPATSPWGPGYSTIHEPKPGECTSGWLPFAIPEGTSPTSFFGTDVGDPQSMAISWELGDDQLDEPQVGVGFPNELLIATVQERCGASAVDVGSGDDASSWDAATSVAVVEAPDRIAIYLGDDVLTVEDLPRPSGDGTAVLAVIANVDGDSIVEGDYSVEDGTKSAVVRTFAGGDTATEATDATVTISEVSDDYVCGVIESSGDVSIAATFGAPLWQPN